MNQNIMHRYSMHPDAQFYKLKLGLSNHQAFQILADGCERAESALIKMAIELGDKAGNDSVTHLLVSLDNLEMYGERLATLLIDLCRLDHGLLGTFCSAVTYKVISKIMLHEALDTKDFRLLPVRYIIKTTDAVIADQVEKVARIVGADTATSLQIWKKAFFNS